MSLYKIIIQLLFSYNWTNKNFVYIYKHIYLKLHMVAYTFMIWITYTIDR